MSWTRDRDNERKGDGDGKIDECNRDADINTYCSKLGVCSDRF